jgi:type IV pilus assembly protein PilV
MNEEAQRAMRSESGFTLLELLVAITILAVGLMGTLNMQSTGLRANGFAQRTTSAAAVARAAMDELISRPGSDVFFDTAQAAGTAYDLDQQTAAMTQTVQGIPYAATITVTPNATVNGSAITNLTSITLTVVGSDRTVTLTELKRAL